MMRHLRHSLGRGHGATATETIMMIVLVAMIVMAGVKMLQGGISTKVDFANDSVGAITTENRDLDKLHDRARKNKNAGAGAAASPTTAAGTTAAGGAGGESAVAAGKKEGGAVSATQQGGAVVQPQGGCAGFNPFLIPIVLGLAGLLGYVLLKSQKG